MDFKIRRVDRKDVEGIQVVAFRSWRDTYQHLFPSKVIEKFLDSAYSLELLTKVITKDCLRNQPLFFVAEENGAVKRRCLRVDPDLYGSLLSEKGSGLRFAEPIAPPGANEEIVCLGGKGKSEEGLRLTAVGLTV